MPEVDLWRGVYSEAQAWEDANGVHKMGKLQAGDNVHLVEEYQGWYRIDYENSTAPLLDAPTDSYDEYWVEDREEPQLFGPLHGDEEPEEPPADPPPDGVTDAELGAAFRTIVDFLAARFRG